MGLWRKQVENEGPQLYLHLPPIPHPKVLSAPQRPLSASGHHTTRLMIENEESLNSLHLSPACRCGCGLSSSDALAMQGDIPFGILNPSESGQSDNVTSYPHSQIAGNDRSTPSPIQSAQDMQWPGMGPQDFSYQVSLQDRITSATPTSGIICSQPREIYARALTPTGPVSHLAMRGINGPPEMHGTTWGNDTLGQWSLFDPRASIPTGYYAGSSPSSAALTDCPDLSPTASEHYSSPMSNLNQGTPTFGYSSPQEEQAVQIWDVGPVQEGVPAPIRHTGDGQAIGFLPMNSGNLLLPSRRPNAFGLPLSSNNSSDETGSHLMFGSPVSSPESEYPAELVPSQIQPEAALTVTRHERRPIVRNKTDERIKQDRFLVEMKKKGKSYKEIRRAGRFKEAESTLRGRYRALTKDKHLRVRKPDWTENDLMLLRTAVLVHMNEPLANSDALLVAKVDPTKVPWKKVSEYMIEHGSSYQFGYSTCKKKWMEIYDL